MLRARLIKSHWLVLGIKTKALPQNKHLAPLWCQTVLLRHSKLSYGCACICRLAFWLLQATPLSSCSHKTGRDPPCCHDARAVFLSYAAEQIQLLLDSKEFENQDLRRSYLRALRNSVKNQGRRSDSVWFRERTFFLFVFSLVFFSWLGLALLSLQLLWWHM